jgi:hypothetical protein
MVKMRTLSLILVGATLAGCAATAEQPTRSAQKQQEFQQLIAGKVAGPPVSCLPTYNANDMRVIDEQTVAFRVSGNSVYIAHFPGGCSNLGRPPYTMLTKQVGSAQLCRGDIAQIVDPVNRITVGSCVFGDFTPYTRVR